MKTSGIVFLLLIFSATYAKANIKSDTTFVDSAWHKIPRAQASFYKLDTKDTTQSNHLITRVYDIKGRLRNEMPMLCVIEDGSGRIKKMQDGLCKQWYEDGALKSETEYSKNKPNGKSTYYWPDGKIMKKETFNDGKSQGSECWNKNGQKADCSCIQVMPHYPEGEEALLFFISRKLRYPTIDQEYKIQGTVLVQFTVTKNGQIQNIKVLKSLSATTDAEACRVVALTSPWVPGYETGEPVNVQYTLPIKFRIE